MEATLALPALDWDETSARPPHAAESGPAAIVTPWGNLPLESVAVSARIVGLFAETIVEQTFVNSWSVPLEATCIFPLPDRAAVRDAVLTIGPREIRAALLERRAARDAYDRALAEGRPAMTAEEDRPDVFTIQVGNIRPGERVRVRLTLCWVLPCIDREIEYRFPLTVSPRFMPGVPLEDEPVGNGEAADTDRVPDASRISPPRLLAGCPHPVRLSLEVDVEPCGTDFREFRSSLHAILGASRDDGGVRIRLGDDERLDRDFVLRWKPVGAPFEPQLLVACDDGFDRQGTFALTIVPPTGPEPLRPRDTVFVVDRSAETAGWVGQAARDGAVKLLEALLPQDRFLVLAAADDPIAPSGFPERETVPADESRLDRAKEFVRGLESSGNPELAAALEAAGRALAACPPEREPWIVVLTTGNVGNEHEILRRLQPLLARARILVAALGPTANLGFLHRLTQLGRGGCEAIEAAERLDVGLERLRRQWHTPAVLGLALHPTDFGPLQMVPARVPPLSPGLAATIFGRFHGLPTQPVEVTGILPDGSEWSTTVRPRSVNHPALEAAWARLRVRELEDACVVGRFGGKSREEFVAELVRFSLTHQVLCRFTAYVAVDSTGSLFPGGGLLRSTQPAAVPASQAAVAGLRKSHAPTPPSDPATTLAAPGGVPPNRAPAPVASSLAPEELCSSSVPPDDEAPLTRSSLNISVAPPAAWPFGDAGETSAAAPAVPPSPPPSASLPGPAMPSNPPSSAPVPHAGGATPPPSKPTDLPPAATPPGALPAPDSGMRFRWSNTAGDAREQMLREVRESEERLRRLGRPQGEEPAPAPPTEQPVAEMPPAAAASYAATPPYAEPPPTQAYAQQPYAGQSPYTPPQPTPPMPSYAAPAPPPYAGPPVESVPATADFVPPAEVVGPPPALWGPPQPGAFPLAPVEPAAALPMLPPPGNAEAPMWNSLAGPAPQWLPAAMSAFPPAPPSQAPPAPEPTVPPQASQVPQAAQAPAAEAAPPEEGSWSGAGSGLSQDLFVSVLDGPQEDDDSDEAPLPLGAELAPAAPAPTAPQSNSGLDLLHGMLPQEGAAAGAVGSQPPSPSAPPSSASASKAPVRRSARPAPAPLPEVPPESAEAPWLGGLQPGTPVFPDCRVVRRLGRGLQVGFPTESFEARDAEGRARVILSIREFPSAAEHPVDLSALAQLKGRPGLHPALSNIRVFWLMDKDNRPLSEGENVPPEPGKACRLSIACRYAERTLADRLAEVRAEGGGMSWREFLPILGQIAGALDALGQRIFRTGGQDAVLQHLDLQPLHVLLEPGGLARLHGFGQVRLIVGGYVRLPDGWGEPTFFSAPELRRGVATIRSDQYSLAVLYLCLRLGLDWTRPEVAAIPPTDWIRCLPSTEQQMLRSSLLDHPQYRLPSAVELVERLAVVLQSADTPERLATPTAPPPSDSGEMPAPASSVTQAVSAQSIADRSPAPAPAAEDAASAPAVEPLVRPIVVDSPLTATFAPNVDPATVAAAKEAEPAAPPAPATEGEPAPGMPTVAESHPPLPHGKLVLAAGRSVAEGRQLVARQHEDGPLSWWTALGPQGADAVLRCVDLQDLPPGAVDLEAIQVCHEARAAAGGDGEEYFVGRARTATALSPTGDVLVQGIFDAARGGQAAVLAIVYPEGLRPTLAECLRRAGGISPLNLLQLLRPLAARLDELNSGTFSIDGRPYGLGGLQLLDLSPFTLRVSGAGSGSSLRLHFGPFAHARCLDGEQETLPQTAILPRNPCLAPELLDGHLTPSGDRYALAMTYLLLRSAPDGHLTDPSESDSPNGWKERILSPPVFPERMREYERAVMEQALSWKPAARFPSAKAFLEALLTALVQDGHAALPPGSPPGTAAPPPTRPSESSRTDPPVGMASSEVTYGRVSSEGALGSVSSVVVGPEVPSTVPPRGVDPTAKTLPTAPVDPPATVGSSVVVGPEVPSTIPPRGVDPNAKTIPTAPAASPPGWDPPPAQAVAPSAAPANPPGWDPPPATAIRPAVPPATAAGPDKETLAALQELRGELQLYRGLLVVVMVVLVVLVVMVALMVRSTLPK